MRSSAYYDLPTQLTMAHSLLRSPYQASYALMRQQLADNPKGKQFDFNENVIFGKFDLF